MSEVDGRRSTPIPRNSTSIQLGQLNEAVKNLGREMGEVKGKVSNIETAVTTLAAQAPNNVTKAECAETRSSCAETRSNVTQDLKDRMDGKREITGITQIPQEIRRYSNGDKNGKTVSYWVKLASAIVALLMFFAGAVIFINRINERQEDQAQILENQQEILQKIANDAKSR